MVYVRGPHGGAYGFRMANIRNRCCHHFFPASTYGCRAGRLYLALPPPGRSARTFQAVGATVVEAWLAQAPDESRPDAPYGGGALLDVRGS